MKILLRCPFCGGEAESKISRSKWIIYCKVCKAQTESEKNIEKAYEKWNSRTKIENFIK